MARKVLIVGLGLMGGSYAAALSSAGYEVGGISDRREALDFALRKGWIASGHTSPDPDYIRRFDIVVSALYPRVFVDWVRSNGKHLRSGAILTDVSGVKACVVPVFDRTDCRKFRLFRLQRLFKNVQKKDREKSHRMGKRKRRRHLSRRHFVITASSFQEAIYDVFHHPKAFRELLS